MFHADYSSIITVLLYYFLSLLFCVVTVSYCCIHMTSTVYCCVNSVTIIHSYKILLHLWYLAYHSCMYVTIIRIKMCLSINNVSKSGGEYKIAWKVDMVLGFMSHIHALQEIKTNKRARKKYVLSHIFNYRHISIDFVVIIKVALQEFWDYSYVPMCVSGTTQSLRHWIVFVFVLILHPCCHIL